MKIGLLCNFYGFPQYTDKVLSAWKNIKEISCTAVSSYKYQDYAECGWDVDDTETPIQLLTEHRDFIDYICLGKQSNDSFSRNSPLNHLLTHDIDYIWLLDQDEIYSEEEINNVIEFIKNNQNYCTYKINFKNFVFSEKTYIEGFNPPRIFAVNANGKKTISHFYYENDIAYNINNQLIDYKQLPILEIPKEICNPIHYSWCGDSEFLKAKVNYQLKRYNGICSYKWNEKENQLEFNQEFYKMTCTEIPKIHDIL
jgi:hypothetical protein